MQPQQLTLAAFDLGDEILTAFVTETSVGRSLGVAIVLPDLLRKVRENLSQFTEKIPRTTECQVDDGLPSESDPNAWKRAEFATISSEFGRAFLADEGLVLNSLRVFFVLTGFLLIRWRD